MNHPEQFLNLVFHESTSLGDHLALCAGFERGYWRLNQLADHVMEWLPEFAFNYSELQEIGHHNAVSMTKKAAKIIYETEKYGLRGEFGEILLHIAIRQVYETIPAVSKIYYKNSINKTVEGFDAVHVISKDDNLELWIGETKFYSDVNSAIYDVCSEIVDHLETDYLKSEFLLIKNKIDPTWPQAESLKALLNNNVSLDHVFERACIPVLLTYDSGVINKSIKTNEEYLTNIVAEMKNAYKTMRANLKKKYEARFQESLPLTVHVILIPLKEKEELMKVLNTKLKALQV